MARYYPDLAFRRRAEGQAKLSCTVTPDGALTACQVLEETPADMGFGIATKYLAGIFRLAPLSRDGEPTRGMIYVFKVTWRLP